MLATTWSKPMATKPVIGKMMARILPPMSSAAKAIQTARQTSQLQAIARRKIWRSVSVTALVVAIPVSRAKVRAPGLPAFDVADPITPVFTANR